MSSNSAIFSGSSRYANDFVGIIDRAVAIASLPLTQLHNQKNNLNLQSTALSEMDAKFEGVLTAVKTLDSTISLRALVTNASVAAVTVGSGALEGVYSLEVLDVGSFTNTLNMADLPVVDEPSAESISTSSAYTLTVDGVTHAINPASNTLSALAQAINVSNAGVHATIINLGTSTAPNYRLSLIAKKLGAVSVQLNDGSRDLLSTLATGSTASYQINGQPAIPISSDTRSVIISPGVTVQLLDVGTTEITVSRAADSVRDALASFVAAYNASVDELDKHRGSTKGALNGQSLLYTLANSLRDVVNYDSGSGQITSLLDLGIAFDKHGKLVFDQQAFASASGDLDKVLSFLGDTTSSGFLKSAYDTINDLENSTDGVIHIAINSVQQEIKHQDKLIEDNQLRIDLLRQALTAKIAAADALIASLEQQVLFLNGLIDVTRANTR
jgi:flagellar hook-associated protein 2